MGDVVNLRGIRKRKQREERLAEGAEQRVRHGRSPANQAADQERLAREQARFDGHRLETSSSDASDALLPGLPSRGSP